MEELKTEFIFDCKIRDLAPRTVKNYEKQLDYFVRFLAERQGVKDLEELKPIHIKQFIAMLIHFHFRCIANRSLLICLHS